jgi:predicted phage terminase large subunit-like protein
LHRWRNEAGQAGRAINRIVVAYEAGRDGFWLARWLRARDVEAYVIHPASVAVSHEHRRAKTDRLDTELLMRALLGWLRGARAARVKPEGNKLARMSIQSAKFGARQVFFPKAALWLAALEAELFSFPGGRHDDQIDSVSQALAHITGGYDTTLSWVG